ncbi:PRC-barrel domain-containing protein [Falsibacillus albus]|uniref:Photosystem reaction center subunit H n=1 Tax=Falsibacillus albus TaxID=2478915 RepID=A0A3L7K611_9BACI|nr:PRC-barrel domain-containing protein [Falsibacillus albus]RLQ98045.1 photosystem reaction center subunit H [Falsibacillus albus]
MKKSAEIKRLPIINIAEGVELGRVKSLVINPEKGSVDFLTIEHEDWQVSVKAIPFKKVVGIGEYAVTVENENAVIDLNEIPIANQLVNKKIKINDTRVMTRKGQLIGEITEYYVDDENGSVLGLELKVKDEMVILQSEFVLTYGKDIIIVKEDSLNHMKKDISQLDDGVIDAHDEAAAASEKAVTPEDQLAEIKSRQFQLLLGKKVTKDIQESNGDVVIPGGTILSEEHIQSAQEAGPSVFVDLTMSIEA